VTFAPGEVGQAFSFDGADDQVEVPNSPSLEPTQVTVEAWVKATNPGIFRYIAEKGAPNSGGSSYALYTGTSGGLNFFVHNNAPAPGNNVHSPDAGPGIWDGNWHYVVGTYDLTTVRLFVDGQEVGAGTPTNLAISYNIDGSPDLFFGSFFGTPGTFGFPGQIDEVSIYNRALSATEIQSIYNAGSAGKCKQPDIQTLNPPSATEGVGTGSFTVATFTDGNPNLAISNLTATVNWGDGTTDTRTSANNGIVASGSGFAVLDGHTYAEEGGPLTFSVTITDSGNSSSAAISAAITVSDAALKVARLIVPVAKEGVNTGSVTVATFTDANTKPDIKDYTATLAWGDGTTDTLTSANGGIEPYGTAFAVVDSHTYGEEGSGLTFAVTITDAGGSSAATSASFKVTDGALKVQSFNPPTNTLAGYPTGTFTVATFGDANTSPDINDYTATVSWGDGKTDTLTSAHGGVVATGGGFALLDGHIYAKSLTGARFSVTIKDLGGSVTSTRATINVGAANDLTITQFAPGSYTEGVIGAPATVATFTDTNPGANPGNLAATVTFGDGTSVRQTLANHGLVQNADGSYSVLASHRYGEEGNYTFSVQITDGTGTSSSTAAAVSVADAALIVKALTPPSPTDNVAFTATVPTFTDANAKPDGNDYTAIINWGDGSTSIETVANGGIAGTTTFSVTGTHTYTNSGNFTLSIQVLDAGGDSTLASALITVNP
jgi:hypothetical protein